MLVENSVFSRPETTRQALYSLWDAVYTDVALGTLFIPILPSRHYIALGTLFSTQLYSRFNLES